MTQVVKVKDLQPGTLTENGLVVRVMPDDEAGKYLREDGKVHVRIFDDHGYGVCGMFLDPESYIAITYQPSDPEYLVVVERLISEVVRGIHQGHSDLDYLHQVRTHASSLLSS